MKLSKRLSKQDREEINRMAEIIRNCRCSNGYISPHVAAQCLFEAGYQKQKHIEKTDKNELDRRNAI